MSSSPPARGHRSGYCALTKSTNGSSPPARGRRQVRRAAAVVWFIPARAGAFGSPGTAPAMSRVHPRPRGVHGRREDAGSAWLGSSPLARGAAWQVRLCTVVRRVHPRPRGAVSYAGRWKHEGLGSSPRRLFVSALYVPDSSSLMPSPSSLPADTASQMRRRIRTLDQR